MGTIQKFRKKITELGGTAPFSSGRKTVYSTKSYLQLLEKLPDSYSQFEKEFGAFSFKNPICIECMEQNPVAGNENKVSVDYFFSVNDGENSIASIFKTYEDQLPAGLLPICEGYHGDLICIETGYKDYGKVFYWFHEVFEDKSTFLIANDFESFIMKLEVKLENTEEDIGEVKMDLSPKLLEMLKKSGFGPK